jgi:hypothetical protein
MEDGQQEGGKVDNNCDARSEMKNGVDGGSSQVDVSRARPQSYGRPRWGMDRCQTNRTKNPPRQDLVWRQPSPVCIWLEGKSETGKRRVNDKRKRKEKPDLMRDALAWVREFLLQITHMYDPFE